MSTNLPAERKPQLVAGGSVAALVPQSLDEAYRLAAALSASGLTPKGFERPEQVMVAIMAGAELGLAPYQALQSFAVVNGRATMWGDSLVAVVRAQGCKIKTYWEGDGPDFPDAMTAVCEVTRPDGEIVAGRFSVADAKRAKLWGKVGRSGEPTPWVTYPKRMLMNRARAFALRDGCADMLRGVQVREEVEDYTHVRDITPKPSGLRERLTGPATDEGFTAVHAPPDPVDFAEKAEEVAEAEFIEGVREDLAEAVSDEAAGPSAEVSDFPGDRPSSAFDVLAWADDLERNLPDYAGVDVLRDDWSDHKADLHAADPARFKDLNQKVARRAAEMAGA